MERFSDSKFDGNQLRFNNDVVSLQSILVVNVGDVLVLFKPGLPKAKELEYKGMELITVCIGIRTTYCPDMQMLLWQLQSKPYFDVVFVRPINPQPVQ